MQQVFPDESASASRKPLISFPLPDDVCNSMNNIDDDVYSRKRCRSYSQSQPASATTAATYARLTLEDCRALHNFIEYGDQFTSAVEHFRHTSRHASMPAQILSGGAIGLTPSSTPLPYQWCTVALRQAQSLLCRIIQLDTASTFLQPALSTKTTRATVSETSATAPGSHISTLELYCRFQALELEFEDVVLRLQSTTQVDAVPETIKQQARTDLEATVHCIEGCVNALEATLVEMLLHLEEPQTTRNKSGASGTRGSSAANSDSNNSKTVAPSLEYVSGIVRGLPEVFQSEQWPVRFVCNNKLGDHVVDESPSSTSVIATLLTGCRSPNVSEFVPFDGAQEMSESSFSSATAAYRAQVGGATTSLALQSLFSISKADVWNLFGVAAASPISRLAAFEKLKNASQSSSNNIHHTDNTMYCPDKAPPPARPALDMEHLEFKDILVRAWNHGYGLLGLRRLRFEMQALFYQYTARASAPASKSSPHRATPQEIYALWCRWEEIVSAFYRVFMCKLIGAKEEMGMSGGVHSCEIEGDTMNQDACALMRQHATPEASFTEVQESALRVVAKLQAVDTKGWFAVPAFDLVNVDFTSMRYWIASPSFAHKSRREAYRSLCRVLERMVDCCVQKYGPTHAFSDTITKVRQQLVDVARAEGLL